MFHIFEKNILCGHLNDLLPDDSNAYVQNMFLRAFKKIILQLLSNTNLTCLSKPSAVSDLMAEHFSFFLGLCFH